MKQHPIKMQNLPHIHIHSQGLHLHLHLQQQEHYFLGHSLLHNNSRLVIIRFYLGFLGNYGFAMYFLFVFIKKTI